MYDVPPGHFSLSENADTCHSQAWLRWEARADGQSEHFVLMFSMSADTHKHGVTTNWPSSVSAVAFAAAIAAYSPCVGCCGTGEVTDCPILPPTSSSCQPQARDTAVDNINCRHEPDAPNCTVFIGQAHTCFSKHQAGRHTRTNKQTVRV